MLLAGGTRGHLGPNGNWFADSVRWQGHEASGQLSRHGSYTTPCTFAVSSECSKSANFNMGSPTLTFLLACVRAYRLPGFAFLQDKVYTGSLKLGESTPSYDAESEVEERLPWEHITDEEIQDAASSFLGDILQVSLARQPPQLFRCIFL
jgi:hypothetical protein